MVAEQAIDEDDVAGPGFVDAQVDACANHTDAGRVDEQLVTGAAFDDLGVAGNDLHAGLPAVAAIVCATVRSVSTGRPSSIMTAHDR